LTELEKGELAAMLKNSLVLVLCAIVGVVIGIAFDRMVLLRETEPELYVRIVTIPDTTYARFQGLHLFEVYGADRNANNAEINFYFPVPESLSIEEKLELLAWKLSRFKFKGLPIEFVELIEDGSDRIAVINLAESEWNRGLPRIEMTRPTWCSGYFQGSCGGGFTSLTLQKTFLQREYYGDWINAVRFLYENEPIGHTDWDHFMLHGIRYSDQARNIEQQTRLELESSRIE